MRRKFVWSPEANALVEVPTTFTQEQFAPMVIPDLPGYQSPVTGLWVEGRRQRRNDLAKSGARPWEGMQQERAEADRRKAYAEQKSEASLDRTVRQPYYALSPEKRRALEGR